MTALARHDLATSDSVATPEPGRNHPESLAGRLRRPTNISVLVHITGERDADTAPYRDGSSAHATR
ncbi:hypothetical protein [Saccharopolyspora gloriosae]|uniref:hypothetical protein n=1 Tax=Saccharopolyspora gloriosae TaxID=455344 RepID=UPI001FB82DE3|nr:hypothetical protein [Saccharopolyspora gloriosae]